MPAPVQSVHGVIDGAGTTCAAAAFTSVAVGDVLSFQVTWQDAGSTVCTLADGLTSPANTYTAVDTILAGGFHQATFSCVVAHGGAITVTATFANTTFKRIQGRQDTGIGALHKHAINSSATFGTGANAVTSGAQTTTIAGCIILGFAYDDTSTTLPTAGTSYVTRDGFTNAAGDCLIMEDQTQGAAGSIAATFTTTAGTDQIFVAMLAYASGGGGTANPPPPVPQQAATHYRAPLTMPQRLGIGMAVFLAPANIGPTVPQGNPAQMPAHQARTAYREAAHLVAQPVPPRILQPGAAASPYQPPARVIFTPPAQLWPYTATMLPEPTASVFGITPIYLGKPPLNHPLPQPWPYGTQPPGPVITQPGAAPTAYLAPAKVNQPLPQPWPHAATMLAVPTASQFGIPDQDLIFDRLYPLMVAPTPWPYTIAQPTPARITAAGAAPVFYLAPNAVTVPTAQPWPYAATQLPEPSASLFAVTSIYLQPNAVPMPATVRWPYALLQPAALLPIIAPAAQILMSPVLQLTQQPWPYTLAQAVANDTADLAPALGVQIPPPSSQQWWTQPPYPYAATMLPAPTASMFGQAPSGINCDFSVTDDDDGLNSAYLVGSWRYKKPTKKKGGIGFTQYPRQVDFQETDEEDQLVAAVQPWRVAELFEEDEADALDSVATTWVYPVLVHKLPLIKRAHVT